MINTRAPADEPIRCDHQADTKVVLRRPDDAPRSGPHLLRIDVAVSGAAAGFTASFLIGPPAVTPLIGVIENEAVHFCTGLREQKARNLQHNSRVALTTGNNSWTRGLDVVVEGAAVKVTDREGLQRLADAYEAKYGSEWHFDVGDGVFGAGENAAAVFRIEPVKVLAFAKEPHAQTTYRLAG